MWVIPESRESAVVPGYYLVCYNDGEFWDHDVAAVVPGYYLVCYNRGVRRFCIRYAVVPGYYLVCYNTSGGEDNQERL